MSRPFNRQTLAILKEVSRQPEIYTKELYRLLGKGRPYKDFYNSLYRMRQLGLLEESKVQGEKILNLTAEGQKLLGRFAPEKDGVWKLVIFDIPEKHQYVRVVLRAKLKALGFKKWQNSIWVSPFALDKEIEDELRKLGKRFFVRMIKTTDINHADDLKKLFQ